MNKRYATSTAELLLKWQLSKNPVTKAVYREIIGRRIDRKAIDNLRAK
jgi:hypothetical protein